MKLWVHALLWLPVAGVCALSCGDDDAKKVAKNGAGGEGGSAVVPSAGGSDAPASQAGEGGGAVALAGRPGEGGAEPVASAGAGGAGELGGAGGDTGSVCAPVIAMGGAGGDPYGGGEWRDWASGECKACPGTPLSCQDLLAAPGPSYDDETGVLSFHIAPGVSEVVSANLSFYFNSPNASDDVSVPAVVEGNDVTVALGGTLPADFYYIYGSLDVTADGCGDQYSTNDTNGYDLYMDRVEGDGGAPSVEFDISCSND